MGNCFKVESFSDFLESSVVGELADKDMLTSTFADAFVRHDLFSGANLNIYEDCFYIIRKGDVIVDVKRPTTNNLTNNNPKMSVLSNLTQTLTQNSIGRIYTEDYCENTRDINRIVGRDASIGDIIIVPPLIARDQSLSMRVSSRNAEVYCINKETFQELIQRGEKALENINLLFSETLTDTMRVAPIFEGLTQFQLEALLPLFVITTISGSKRLFDCGWKSDEDDDQDYMGIVLQGRCLKSEPAKKNTVDTDSKSDKNGRRSSITFMMSTPKLGDAISLLPGQTFGDELCVLSESPAFSQVDVPAGSSTVVAMLYKSSFLTLRDYDPNILLTMQRNLIYQTLLNYKSSIHILKNLSSKQLREVCKGSTSEYYMTDSIIFSDGDIAQSFYIIICGKVEITRHDSDDEDSTSYYKGKKTSKKEEKPSITKQQSQTSIAAPPSQMLLPGEYFGEVSLINKTFQNCTAKASRTPFSDGVLLLVIDRPTFESLFEMTKVNKAIMRVTTARHEAELSSVLAIPSGFDMLMDYLKKEHATESLEFWREVSVYNSLVDDADALVQQELRDSKEKQQSEMNNTSISSNNNSNAAGTGIGRRVSSLGQFLGVKRTPSIIGVSGAELSSRRKKRSVETSSDKLKKIHEKASSILDMYIRHNSSLQVNISSKLRQEVEDTFQRLDSSVNESFANDVNLSESVRLDDYKILFRKVKQEVYNLLQRDSFSRWTKTDEFNVFLNTLFKQP